MSGVYLERIEGSPLAAIAGEILGTAGPMVLERFCDSDGEYQRKYNVYKVTADGREYVLKKSDRREAEIYTDLLRGRGFAVPEYAGHALREGKLWLLITHIPGPDLRHFNRDMALAAAESLAGIQNAYWGTERDPARFARYQKRIEKRARCLQDEPELSAAYRLFLDRQARCPRTLCNGDFLQLNGIFREGRVFLIDWGFGGVMPYALDVARLIAHGNSRREAGGFPFYMDKELQSLFVTELYQRLNAPPPWERYCMDIALAALNEYVEFLEADLDDPEVGREEIESGYYYKRAKAAARWILARGKGE